ncbi:MAG: DUF3568 domain-containing protein [Deltaproteobacteria bacterium]|nr:DUF3568 domain-containing protein [Deltaproteobacteria bacterium]
MCLLKKKMYSRWLCIAVVAMLAVQLCACEGAVVMGLMGAGAGAGTVAYVKGELKTKLNHSTTRTYQATLKALNELKLPILERQDDAIVATIKSRFADEKNITVKIKSVTDTTCEIRIRVGEFGDQTRSQKILDTIKKHLRSG